MKPISFMLIAGETSGDLLGAELVNAIRKELQTAEVLPTWDYQPLRTTLEPRFFGAGGPRMADAGVDLALDMTRHSVVGFSEVVRHYFKFRRIFTQLRDLALRREPDVIICVDFFGFNGRFGRAIRHYVNSRRGWFHDWAPKIIQFVSPQVWASREGRAYSMARDFDLLLSIFPFEKVWYAKRVPRFRVEFVGHPLLDRYQALAPQSQRPLGPVLLLLPGSRPAELDRHLPVMLGALEIMRREAPDLRARMVLPHQALVERATRFGLPQDLEIQTGKLDQALAQSSVAIASSGTVTVECALFGLPTVVIYKTSWSTYQLAKRVATVKHLAMPNLLAGEAVFPELIQEEATADKIALLAIELLRDETRRAAIKARFADVIGKLGSPGASRRAAHAVINLVAPCSAEVAKVSTEGR